MSAPDLYAIRQQHGGKVYAGGRRWVGPGPGHSRRDASLSVFVTDEGRALVHSFAGDPFPACAEHLGIEAAEPTKMDRAAWAQAKRQREAEERQRQNAALAFCVNVWGRVQPPEGTAAARYLLGRGVVGPFASDLAFHPAAPTSYAGPNRAPAMVALVRSTQGAPKGLHVTALKPDGSDKAGGNARRMFGAVTGASAQLGPAGADLAVAEGIETALSFAHLHGLPTWAALSTAGLRTFDPPATVRRLTIAADGDDAGAEAAEDLARRCARRCDVAIVPAPSGSDWNDVLREGSR